MISPAGGLDNVASFVALFGSNKLHVAVLTDFHAGDKRKVLSLRESKLLQDGHVFSADQFAGMPEADVEDILGRALYVGLVNDTFALPAGSAMPAAKPAGAPVRVVAEAEQFFNVLPPQAPHFDHYAPAARLTTESHRLATALPGIDQALDRFEMLFKGLNALMG